MEDKIWFSAPSEDFAGINGALPLGNGYMGAQIEDNVVYERISLNESTVWSGGPYENNALGASRHLSELRARTLREENCDFDWGNYFVQHWGGQIFEPAGDLQVYFADCKGAGDYRKQILLAEGVCQTEIRRKAGTVKKEYFANYPSNVICVRYESDLGSVSFTAEINTRLPGKLTVENGMLLLDGSGSGARGVEGAIRYRIAAKFVTEGGEIEQIGKRLVVRNAKKCNIFLNITSNFNSVTDLSRAYQGEALDIVQRAAARGYDNLRKEHVHDYSALYNRVSFELETDCDRTQESGTRSRLYGENKDPGFVELMFHYNRYLMICASRPGSQPPTLNGKWNDKLSPAWDSKYTVNINLQMNYWSFMQNNLGELCAPLVTKLKQMMENGKRAAKEIYNIERGDAWVLHHNTDLWNSCGAIDGIWGLTPTCGAWLVNELFDFYSYTLEKEYLENIYPLLKGSAEFMLEFLIPFKRDGREYLITCPSTSPERTNGPLGYVTYGSAFDNQIVRELFQNFLAAVWLLGKDKKLGEEVHEKLALLPEPMAVGSWGQVREFYFHDYDFKEDSHRHLAHLYGVHPGSTVFREHNSEWNAAVLNTLDRRSVAGDWTGWGIVWRIFLYARLFNAEKAGAILDTFLTKNNNLYLSNFFGACNYENGPIFQYDCNGGFAGAVLEMFVISMPDQIFLLPAVPKRLHTGRICGVRMRGAFVLQELVFADGAVKKCRILSEKGMPLNVSVNGVEEHRSTVPGGVYELV